jgi:hypothetical protein
MSILIAVVRVANHRLLELRTRGVTALDGGIMVFRRVHVLMCTADTSFITLL